MAGGQKRRNSEKRKEKSRDAARSRRGKEAEIFTDLANQLPLCPTVIEQLDKASVMRLLLSAFKIYTVLGKRDFQDEFVEEGSLEEKMNSLYSKALGGFLVVLSKDGDFMYVSETVAKYLGIQQIDLMGQSIFEFSHPCDHDEIQDMLSGQNRDEDDDAGGRSILVRLKCTLTSKGRSVNLKSATYKVIQLSGKYVPDEDGLPATVGAATAINMCIDDEDSRELEMMDADDGDEMQHKPSRQKALPYLIAIGEPIPHPSNIEVPLDKRTFLSRHSMNMRFTDCDERIKHLIGYQHEEMIDTSFYGFHHAMDSKMMEKAFKDLFSKGQTCTEQYRFLAKNGGYVWVVTQATVIFNTRTQKPQCVVCVHYVLSHVEQHGRVLSALQGPSLVKEEEPINMLLVKVEKSPPRPQMPVLPKLTDAHDKRVAELLHVPIFSTEDVFGDTSDDMDDMYNQPVINKESFGTSLSLYDDLPYPDIKNRTAQTIKQNKKEYEVKGCKQMDLDASPPMAPMLNSLNPRDNKTKDCLLNNYNSDVEIDFEHRAPFITMNAEEDFQLKQPSKDVFLNMGIDLDPAFFGCTETVFNLKDELYDGPPPEKRLQTPQEMLGGSTVKASIERPQDKMMMRLKRPLNRSCLEKGPPLKMTKYQGLVKDSITASPTISDNCYLKALLLMKEDHRTGISAGTKNISRVKEPPSSYLRTLLTNLSPHDLERSMPVRNGHLLEGADIQRALDGLIK